MEPEDLDGKSPRALARERKRKQRANASEESKGKERAYVQKRAAPVYRSTAMHVCKGPGVARRGAVHVH